MRKMVFLFVAFFTGYMAGEFRQLWLMVLFAMEVFLFVGSFFLPFYFKDKLSVRVPRHSEVMEKETWISCRIIIRNEGRLPVSRFQVKFCYGYTGRKGKEGFGRRQEKPGAREIYGSCDRGENVFHFEITGRYCGFMKLRVVRLRAYDYLALFSASDKTEETVEVAVFPREKTLCLAVPFLGAWGDAGSAEQAGAGESGSEVRQLREYRSGDSSRYIHWNQSARTGQLWVKEYDKESDARVGLFLDLEGLKESDVRERDAFYELLSALILGLLEKAQWIRVCWYDGIRKCVREKEVWDGEQNRELLFLLYRMMQSEDSRGKSSSEGIPERTVEPGKAQKKKPGKEDGHQTGIPGKRTEPENRSQIRFQGMERQSLTLDWKLRLYWKGELLFAFSAECLEQQIADGIGR